MDAEAFALIGTGFDCHVQRRLIKPKLAKSPKIAATFRTHVQDQVVFFQVLLNDFNQDTNETTLSCHVIFDDKRFSAFLTARFMRSSMIFQLQSRDSAQNSAECWNHEGNVKTVSTTHVEVCGDQKWRIVELMDLHS